MGNSDRRAPIQEHIAILTASGRPQMTAETLTFSGDDSAPEGSAIPTADELQAIGQLGTELHRGGRVTLMNQIGGFLGIPAGGWNGQVRLFDGNDIRLRWLLAKLAKERYAKLVSD